MYANLRAELKNRAQTPGWLSSTFRFHQQTAPSANFSGTLIALTQSQTVPLGTPVSLAIHVSVSL